MILGRALRDRWQVLALQSAVQDYIRPSVLQGSLCDCLHGAHQAMTESMSLDMTCLIIGQTTSKVRGIRAEFTGVQARLPLTRVSGIEI